MATSQQRTSVMRAKCVAAVATAVVLSAAATVMRPAEAAEQSAYQGKCATCHGPIDAFARQSLSVTDGILVSRKMGVDLAVFLRSHGRATPADVPLLIEALRKARAELSPAMQ